MKEGGPRPAGQVLFAAAYMGGERVPQGTDTEWQLGCGGGGEPCVTPQQRVETKKATFPYFRQGIVVAAGRRQNNVVGVDRVRGVKRAHQL